MKVFSNENGKEVVFVQYCDLRILNFSSRTPKSIKKEIPMHVCSELESEEYFKYDNEEIVSWLKNIYYILDFDKFSKMSNDAIYKEYKENELRIDKILHDLKKMPKKERIKQIGLYEAYNDLEHYSGQILKFLQFREINLPNGKVYINKKDNVQ